MSLLPRRTVVRSMTRPASCPQAASMSSPHPWRGHRRGLRTAGRARHRSHHRASREQAHRRGGSTMSNPINTPAHERLPPRLAAGALTLLLAACATTERPSKARDAAAYNVQLGIAYLHQGDVALAKDKLDRALAEDPSSADVHSARAMLFERMHNPATADAELRTSLRLAPHDPQV